MARRSRLYQLDPILIDGVLRVGGRRENSHLAFDLKHPIILPEGGYLTQLIIEQAHSQFMGHYGVNTALKSLCQRFWILNVKVALRKVINRCVACKKSNTKPAQQVMADLPYARLQVQESPFTPVGVDCFGPLLASVKRSDVKRYGCLFTCMTTRAIHLELLRDLSASLIINVLRRF